MDAFPSTLVTACQQHSYCLVVLNMMFWLSSFNFSFFPLFFFLIFIVSFLHDFPPQTHLCASVESKRWTRCGWLELFPEHVVIGTSCQEEVDTYRMIAFSSCFEMLSGIIDAWKAVSLSNAILGLSEGGKNQHSSDWKRHLLRYCLSIDLPLVVDLEHWLESNIWAKVVHVQCQRRYGLP